LPAAKDAIQIDENLADRALHHLVSNPETFGMDALLVTAALRLAEQAQKPIPPVMERLQHHVLAHLRGRIAKPLSPPRTGGATVMSLAPAPTAMT